MKGHLFIFLLFLKSTVLFGWGQNGHRIVGEIAYNHLTKKAKRNIQRLLGNESLAMISTYMDEIRSDSKYDYLAPWHYCTVPDGKTYEEAGIPQEGDVVQGIKKFVDELKNKTLSYEEKIFALKCLVHLVGDIHQPLHVGNGLDRGGNAFAVKFFGEHTNLHSVWDTKIIEYQNLSFTEYVRWIDHPSREQISSWQSDGLMTWVEESKNLRDRVYDVPDDKNLSYLYIFKNTYLLNKRLLQAGVRLAGILNEIFG